MAVSQTESTALPYGREVTLYVMLSGVLAGLMITVLSAVCRVAGLMNFSLERAFGTLLLGTSGPGSWIVGLVLHLAFSAIFALLYAEGFRRMNLANARIGAAFGVVHWIAIGIFIGILPSLRPMMAATVSAPGPFALSLGYLGFFLLLAMHLIFGAVVGTAYKRMAHEHPEILTAK